MRRSLATRGPELTTIGIDVGTTGLKAVALDADARLTREHTVRYPTALAGAAAEQDPNAWWSAARTALRAVTVPGEPVRGVAVTAQGPTLVRLDGDGRVLGPALTWIDRRATDEAAEIAALLGATRNGADPYFGTAKLLWWARHGALADAAAALTANGFLAHRLTGRGSFDTGTAGLFTGWDDGFPPALAAAGVPVGLLGDAVAPTAIAGTVTPSAAAATGLPAGTPVAAGGIDAIGAALEAGLRHPGDGVVAMTGFSAVSVQPVPAGTTVTGMIHTRHCVPGTDLLLTAQVSAGALVDWLARLTGHDSAAILDAAVPERRPGRLALLPSFAGERTPTWDPAARGAIAGLDLATTAGDLLLAVYEGLATALRADLETVAAAWRPPPDRSDPVLMVGGGARSRHWPQVTADVLGRPVRVPAAGHGAAYGAAVLAGVATGRWPDFDAVPPVHRDTRAVFTPDAGRHARYTRRLPLVAALRDHPPALTADLGEDR